MGCGYGNQSSLRLRGAETVKTRCGGFGPPTPAIRAEAQKAQDARRGKAGAEIALTIGTQFDPWVHVDVTGDEVTSIATADRWSEIKISLKGDRRRTLLMAFNRRSPDVLYRILNNSDGTPDIERIALAEKILSRVDTALKKLGPGGGPRYYYEDERGHPIAALDPRIRKVQQMRR